MKNYCNQCGLCCKAIPLLYSMKEIKYKTGEDPDFIKENWVEITKEEAIKINPLLLREPEKNRRPHEFYFKCTKFIDNKCSCYNERPGVCSKYPYVGKIYRLGYLINSSETCGFVKNFKKAKRTFRFNRLSSKRRVFESSENKINL